MLAQSGANSAAAQTIPPAVVAIVDYDRILREAAAARGIREQIEARRLVYQEEIASEERRLNDADKELAGLRGSIDPEVFAERRRKFEAEVAEVQRKVQDRRRELDEALGAALAKVRAALVEIVSEIADASKINVVLPRSGVLIFSPAIDLTAEVMTALDERLPDVDVPEPGD